MNYCLKLYDENLMKFTMDSELGKLFVVSVVWFDENKLNLLPLELTSDVTGGELDEVRPDWLENHSQLRKISELWKDLSWGLLDYRLSKWLKNRVIPKNREFVEKILETLGLTAENTKGIIDVCKGLSLNDSFWVVPEGFEGTFAECNLYENKFSEVLSLVAYTGYGSKNEPFTTSPELTTNGMLPKAWRNIDGKIVLYKGGSSGFANSGLEPYSEYYACQIADKMELNPVIYGLEKWKGILASTCELFTDINTAFIPTGRLVKTGGYKAVAEWYKKQDEALGTNMFDYFASILVFDAIIYNVDRHFGNFGVLRDNRSGKIIGHAPIFDNGLGLFSEAMKDNLNELDEYRKKRLNNIAESFDSYVKAYAGKKQKEQLRKLIGFKFTPHEKYNWEPERLRIIQDFIQNRVQELLNIIEN